MLEKLALAVRAADANIVAEVTSAQRELDNAFKNQDAATIRRMMTSDHVAVTPSHAAALSVAEQVAKLADMKISAYNTQKLTITPIGSDVGVATMVKSYQGTFKDKPLPSSVFATSIWTKVDGTWRERLYQETAITGP